MVISSDSMQPCADRPYQFESVRSFFASTLAFRAVEISDKLNCQEAKTFCAATEDQTKTESKTETGKKKTKACNPYLAELVDERAQRPVSVCPFKLLSRSMMEAEVNGLMWLRLIDIAAHRGSIQFARDPELLNESLSLFLYKAFTGETSVFGVARGQGRIYLANGSHQIFFVYLDNEVINLQGLTVLAFEDTLEHKVQMIGNAAGIIAGGMYSLRLEGRGWAAFSSCGYPVTLPCSNEEPLTCMPIKALAWSGCVDLKVGTELNRLNLMNRGIADAVQVVFTNNGFVAIHSDEDYMYTKIK
ncbi:MAG: AIM24 family protein [Candidatus Bruticola sp.]